MYEQRGLRLTHYICGHLSLTLPLTQTLTLTLNLTLTLTLTQTLTLTLTLTLNPSQKAPAREHSGVYEQRGLRLTHYVCGRAHVLWE